MMYIDNEVLEKMIMTIVEGFDRIEKKLDRMGRVKDCLNGDELLDNYDIAKLLNVSLRTVARYREKGLIRYYQTDDNGKNFYRSSEIQEFLQKRGKKDKGGNTNMGKLCKLCFINSCYEDKCQFKIYRCSPY